MKSCVGNQGGVYVFPVIVLYGAEMNVMLPAYTRLFLMVQGL